MTRIWLEFDQLEALKERLASHVWWELYWFRQEILIKIGFGKGDKKTDSEIVDMIRDECLMSFDEDKFNRGMTPAFKSFDQASEDEKKGCYTWADEIIKILKEKGDVR